MTATLRAGLVLLVLGLAAQGARANNIFLTTDDFFPTVGDTLLVDIWMDFTTDPTIGGGLDIFFDPGIFMFVDYDAAPLGDPAFQRDPMVGDGELIGIAFGDFAGLAGPALVGTLAFDVLAPPFNTSIFAQENRTTVGPFFSATTFSEQDVVLSGVVFGQPIPLPGALWLLVSAMAAVTGAAGCRRGRPPGS